jgi:DNA adenine methylase
MSDQVESINLTTPCKPFLRWTGSKSWLVKEHLRDYIPTEYNNYHEPFLGAGSVFFHLAPTNQSYLTDVNEELINTYLQIRDNLENVIESLRGFINTEQEYYKIRSSIPSEDYQRAARFIYLNRTSFNGIYRVNNNGIYNVPYGKRVKVDVVTEVNLKAVSKALQNKVIECADFTSLLNNVKSGDLVYLDPPYTIAHENNGFIEYNRKLFSWDDQKKLSLLVRKLDEIGIHFILSNAEHIEIRNLYMNVGKIKSVSRYSKVGGRNKTRGIFNEVIISNLI